MTAPNGRSTKKKKSNSIWAAANGARAADRKLHENGIPPLGGTYVIRSHRDCRAIHRHMVRQMSRSRISSSR